MLVKADKPGHCLKRRRRVLAMAFATCCLLCGMSFVAGGEAFRQGTFHDLREYAQAAMKPATRVRAWLNAPQPPVIVIDMKFKHLRTLQAKREEALTTGFLLTSEDDWVPANLSADDAEMNVRMRLKGDSTDHLQGRKWSFRVKTKGDHALWGMKVFSLQHPKTRSYQREWFYHQHLRTEGLLALRYRFVRVIFNGEDLGIYALEEHFSKELLESQKRREGPILKFDETGMWERCALGQSSALMAGDYTATSIDLFGAGKLAESPVLSDERDAAVQLLEAFVNGELPASKVFKVPQLATYFAMSELYGSWHSLAYHNMRFYYDPIEARLEPIGFDVNSNLTEGSRDPCALSMPWARDALKDPILARAYVAELVRLNDPQYLENLKSELAAPLDETVLLLNREWPVTSAELWDSLAQRQQAMRANLAVHDLVRGRVICENSGQSPMPDSPPLGADLEIYNNTRLPVEVVSLNVDKRSFSLTNKRGEGIILAAGDVGRIPEPFHGPIKLDGPVSDDVSVTCRLLGGNIDQRNPLHRQSFLMPAGGPRPESPDIADLLTRHPFLKWSEQDSTLNIAPGRWEVEGDLILPDGVAVIASPGTTLAFGDHAAFVCGGPVQFAGTDDEPIILRARGGRWGGMLVRSSRPSLLDHVNISDATAIERRGWFTTGGVTFYRSSVTLDNCRFADCHGEDGLNVVSAEVNIRGCEFVRCASDAFDGDYVTGSVTATRMLDIAGDGIDVSSSRLDVNDVQLGRIGDKAISAGEQSDVNIESVHVFAARIGVASKDSSSVEIAGLEVSDTTIALAAYIKKSIFDPAQINARGVTLTNVDTPALAQHRCRIVLDGVALPTRSVDVDALYATVEQDGGDGSF